MQDQPTEGGQIVTKDAAGEGAMQAEVAVHNHEREIRVTNAEELD